MRTLLCLSLLFVYSCAGEEEQNPDIEGVFYLSGASNIEDYKRRTLVKHKPEDNSCTDGLSNLGTVKVYLLDTNDGKKITQSEQSLDGVKGNPISSSFINSVIVGQHEQIIKKNCSEAGGKKIACTSFNSVQKSPGEEVRLCKREYSQDSLENHILAAVLSVQKTLECTSTFFPDKKEFPKLNIEIFPKTETIFTMQDGSIKNTFKTDNAYHSGGGSSLYAKIAFLPHSTQNLATKFNNNEITLNLGVGAHETGHFVFNQYTGAALSLTNHQAGLANHHNYRIISHDGVLKDKRSINTKLVYSAVNEGIGDAISTICFYENEYANLRFGLDSNTRDSAIETFSIRDPRERNTKLTIEKILSTDRLRHFFSKKTTYAPSSSVPNDKDIHHIGSIIIYGLFKYWEVSGVNFLNNDNPSDLTRQLEKAKALLMEAIRNIGEVVPDKEPSIYLDDLIFAMVKGAMEKDDVTGKLYVEDKVCDVFKKYFPVNFIGFQNNFVCR